MKLKKVIDVVMLVLFIVLMGYHITGNKVHEIIGVITFLLFIVHNILNIKWYKTILKGKFNFYRVFQIIINLLLLISMFGIIISGIIISTNVFSFLNIPTTMFGRNLHMISTSWAFILMSIHVGMHLNIILLKLNKKMKNSVLEYIYYLIVLVLMVTGLYMFITSDLWKDMLLLNKFKFFDYNQNPYIFYLGQFTIFIFVSFTIYLMLKLSRFKKNR